MHTRQALQGITLPSLLTLPARATGIAFVLMLIGCGPFIRVPTFRPEELARLQHERESFQERGYRIEPGDTLLIRYPFHPEMDQEAMVRPDGKVTIGGIGPVTVGGLTPPELERDLKERTSARLKNPEVTVNIVRFGERPVYVGGEVGRPGSLVYRKGLTPLQAIIAAGGFLSTARLDSVILARPEGPGDQYVARKLNLKRVLHAGEKEQLQLAPNDVIFVPRTPIANANVWVRQHITELVPFIRVNPTGPLGF